MKTSPALPWLLAAALLWGSLGLGVRAWQSIQTVSGVMVGFWRLSLAVPFLWIWLLRSRAWRPIQGCHRLWLALYGLMMALYQITTVGAIARVGVAVAILLAICLAPVVVVILSGLMLQETITLPVLLGVVTAITGAALVVDWDPQTQVNGLGIVLGLGSAICYGVIVLCSRRLAGHYHPIQVLSLSFTIAAAFLTPFFIAQGSPWPNSGLAWVLVGYIALVPTVLAYACFLQGIQHSSATLASITTLLEPLIATLFAWILFGESLSFWSGLGAVLLLSSIFWLQAIPRNNTRDPKS
ncbi:MAG: EamA family transporter [Thermostichales cyanobacterium BF4_bins_65]